MKTGSVLIMQHLCDCKTIEHMIINPRRACAARVTKVDVLSATILALALQATRRLMSDANSFSATRARKLMWRFC